MLSLGLGVEVNTMVKDRQSLVSLVILGCASVLAARCAPVFSELQSAKLVGRDRVEITPSYSSISFSGEDGGHVQDEYGLQMATGVTQRLDLRARYVHVEGVNVVGFGPKVSVVKDKVALAVPVGFAFGEDVDSGKSWAIHPTLLLTAPVNRHVELNASTKALIPFSEGDKLVALNLGAGFGALEQWAIRPEVGFLFNPGENGHFTQVSVAFTYFAGKKRQNQGP
jgi:hypothetical protein